MKLTATVSLLAASLLANAVLLVPWQRGAFENGSPFSAVRSKVDARKPVARADEKRVSLTPETWRSLQSGDLATLMRNLRAAGFPSDMVRAVIVKRVVDLFDARRRELVGDPKLLPFWDAKRELYAHDRVTKLQPLWKEQQKMLNDLLGLDAADDDTRDYQRHRLAFLSAEKIGFVTKIENDYGEMAGDATYPSVGVRPPSARDALGYLEREKRADLAAVLTPKELEQYDLYTSSTAQNMRRQLAAFQPTEEELREIFELRRVVDERFSPRLIMSDPSNIGARSSAKAELETQIEAALGEQRYADYERSQDEGLNAATQIVEHFKLPAQNAAAVYDLQRSGLEAKQRIFPDGSMSISDEQRAALAALAREMSDRLSALLTPDGLTAYRQTGGTLLRGIESFAKPQTLPSRPPGGG